VDLFKNFHVTERVTVQLRGEGYNMLNHHSFQGVTSSNLPPITSTVFGQYNSVAQGSRFGQLAARIIF